MRSRLIIAACLPALILAGCADPFGDAKKLDTKEAYEAFLAENPNSPKRMEAELRLQTLVFEDAVEKGTLEAFDAYLERFPEGNNAAQIRQKRLDALWRDADAADTAEAWTGYIEQAKAAKANTKDIKRARKRLRVAENQSAFEIGPVTQEQVNLAENPDGPLDGWGFYADVTNKTDEPISYFIIRIDYLDGDGRILDSDEQAAVARYWNIPMPADFYKPIMPGDTRTWSWTTGDMPTGWAKKVSLKPVDIVIGVSEEEAK